MTIALPSIRIVIAIAFIILGAVDTADAEKVKYRIRVQVGDNGTRHRVWFSVRGERGGAFSEWVRLRGKFDGDKPADFSYALPDVGPIDRLRLKLDVRGTLDDWTPGTIEVWYPPQRANRRSRGAGTKSTFTIDKPIASDPATLVATIADRPGVREAALPVPKKRTLDPTKPGMKRVAPDWYWTAFDTTKGIVVIEVDRAAAPRGADRFYNLVYNGFYDRARLFRVVRGFMAQFGLPADPKVAARFVSATIPDDPVVARNTRGAVAFAMAGPGSRTTQVFVSTRDNTALDADGFAPFGRVVLGMDVVDRFFAEYGDAPPNGSGPDQARIREAGERYLAEKFPKLDTIRRATLLRERPAVPAVAK